MDGRPAPAMTGQGKGPPTLPTVMRGRVPLYRHPRTCSADQRHGTARRLDGRPAPGMTGKESVLGGYFLSHTAAVMRGRVPLYRHPRTCSADQRHGTARRLDGRPAPAMTAKESVCGHFLSHTAAVMRGRKTRGSPLEGTPAMDHRP
ncbi:hypothetical protein DF3PB_420001 [uncultured Defluviicoccus sp.]|uniref:Uncharacterized protein n=1 Tax=metagenome TaxID=256318 RepID=A0A380TI30_9ZZZZ|nr:hypothetical protein DF3PB_420001 [uncultured Defluviicoccus sp.]